MSALALAVVVIPARDEATAIGDVISELRAAGALRIVVADNGSSDGTEAIADAAGAEVIRVNRRGYGWACLAGSSSVRESGAVAFIDGDGSFRAADLERLAAVVTSGQADLAIGIRTGAAVLPMHQRVGNALVCAALRTIYGVTLQDVGPLRVIRGDLLEMLDMQGSRYAWLVEMLAKSARSGARIATREVSYGPRRGGTSKVSGSARGSLLAGLDFVRAVAEYRSWTTRL